ncbi:LAMI_0D07052g1_1 [Lachancea mirantina]|uniref:LAMI_0D07052g1_1 n=1 Tax=Lachancea mirantina TaxID=1230905 RepID=A0A1G4JCQ6_9SACH|nr:LAMI_0D07052g1_1 [Lachancea mirantina]
MDSLKTDDTNRYPCPHPKCNKSFTRREHLSRHKLNHWPKEIFKCTYRSPEGGTVCNRTFVRRDLLVRHKKRHQRANGRLSIAIAHDNNGLAESDAEAPEAPKAPEAPEAPQVQQVWQVLQEPSWDTLYSRTGTNTILEERLPQRQSLEQFVNWIFEGDKTAKRDPTDVTLQFPLQHAVETVDPGATNVSTSILDDFPSQQSSRLISNDVVEDPLAALIQELVTPPPPLDVASINNALDNPTGLPPYEQENFSGTIRDNVRSQKNKVNSLRVQVASDEQMEAAASPSNKSANLARTLNMSPSFFSTDPLQKYKMSPRTLDCMIEIIPALSKVPIEDIEKGIKSFWLNFHPQYPILHKPSFQISLQPPVLLLSMTMIGASFLGSEYKEKLSDVICLPLRWVIFSHEDFQPPSETYIIYSLLLLECYEKANTSRYLHERSYLHHGTTIQLLRRTPSLGGHPLHFKTERFLKDKNTDDIFCEWIQFEFLKRTAFFAFYVDATHAVVFGYTNLFINCDQMQLSLPCSDEIWESSELDYSSLIAHGFGQRPTRFLDALKGLMQITLKEIQDQNSQTEAAARLSELIPSRYGSKILLAGIISMMFHFQQQSNDTGLLNVFHNANSTLSWQEMISHSIDLWETSILKGCGNSKNFSESIPTDLADPSLSFLVSERETKCKLPAYHMAQITMRIFQYDYTIFAGAPWRMNVKTGKEEYELVSLRLQHFSQDPMIGGVTLVYAYQFLFEVFDEGKSMDYDPNVDCNMARPQTLTLVILLIWGYNFARHGPEADVWDDFKRDKSQYVPKETASSYISRLARHLKLNSSSDVARYRDQVKKKALILHDLTDTNNVCGLLCHMRDIFGSNYWELSRELARLFDNCIERSMGRKSITCPNMYSSQSKG